MKVVVTSDTHLGHHHLGRLEGDVLVHCGDFYDGLGCVDESLSVMNEWFAQQAFRLKIFVGGNHDFPVFNARKVIQDHLEGVVYLEDQKLQFEGVSFYGSPWVPELFGWAYFCDDEIRKEVWRMIPSGLDFLITHTPPYGILDQSSHSKGLGCRHLRRQVKKVRPRFHCFGHIHASYGRKIVGATEYLNVSAVSNARSEMNPPIVLEL